MPRQVSNTAVAACSLGPRSQPVGAPLLPRAVHALPGAPAEPRKEPSPGMAPSLLPNFNPFHSWHLSSTFHTQLDFQEPR